MFELNETFTFGLKLKILLQFSTRKRITQLKLMGYKSYICSTEKIPNETKKCYASKEIKSNSREKFAQETTKYLVRILVFYLHNYLERNWPQKKKKKKSQK